jgi:hypothetical protein
MILFVQICRQLFFGLFNVNLLCKYFNDHLVWMENPVKLTSPKRSKLTTPKKGIFKHISGAN